MGTYTYCLQGLLGPGRSPAQPRLSPAPCAQPPPEGVIVLQQRVHQPDLELCCHFLLEKEKTKINKKEFCC